jgi:hypothetical protein
VPGAGWTGSPGLPRARDQRRSRGNQGSTLARRPWPASRRERCPAPMARGRALAIPNLRRPRPTIPAAGRPPTACRRTRLRQRWPLPGTLARRRSGRRAYHLPGARALQHPKIMTTRWRTYPETNHRVTQLRTYRRVNGQDAVEGTTPLSRVHARERIPGRTLRGVLRLMRRSPEYGFTG